MSTDVLHCTPKTLVYPLAQKDVSVCTSILRLENKGSQLLAFKVKTTAVKRYVVRPNLGILLPGKSVEVAVLLNYERARAENVDLAAVHDRFQVLYVPVDVTSSEQLLELWAKTPEEQIGKMMVKCKFVAPNLVKTMTPVKSLSDPATTAAGEPDLEQAKQNFKAEMASTKAKQELKTLRTERDNALAQLSAQEKELTELREEVARLREGGKNGSRAAGAAGAAAGGTQHASAFGRVFRFVLFLFMYLLLLLILFLVVFKGFGYDPLLSLAPQYSMTMLELRLLRFLNRT